MLKNMSQYAMLPQPKKYDIIYADPPWEVMAGSKQSRKTGDSQKSMPLSYPTMKLDEIKSYMRWAFEHRNEAKAMGKKASDRIQKDWTWSKAVDKLVKIISKYN